MEIGLVTRALVAATLVTVGVPVRAEVIPGRWEKLEQRCRPQISLMVTLLTAEELRVSCQGTTQNELLLTTLDGAEIRVPKSQVVRVEAV